MIAAAIPFCLYQWYGFTQFCGLTKPTMNYPESVISYAETHNLKLPSATPKSAWCLEEGSENVVRSMLPPISYSYIQAHYWDQGFMRYYQFKQIPQVCLVTEYYYLANRLIMSIASRQSTQSFSVCLGSTHFIICLLPSMEILLC